MVFFSMDRGAVIPHKARRSLGHTGAVPRVVGHRLGFPTCFIRSYSISPKSLFPHLPAGDASHLPMWSQFVRIKPDSGFGRQKILGKVEATAFRVRLTNTKV